MADGLYQLKYVAFLDLLGFSNLVQQSASDPNAHARVLEAIGRLKETACDNPKTGMISTYFSDCIVLSCDRSPHGLHDMLRSLILIAENLLVVDVLVRGGLAMGAMHHDRQLMFGPAMLEAYRMESKEVRHPTVLIAPEVRADIKVAGLESYIIRDDDGAEPERHYLHYLISFAHYDPTPLPGRLILDEPARLVRHYLARRIADSNGSPLQKALWLERYWNETVAIQGYLGEVDRVADLEVPDAMPFRTRFYIAQGRGA